MCKYCDNPDKYTPICHYSNNKGYGNKYGIGVYATCGIRGNMLSVEGTANRWTKADDYYEDAGLDFLGEYSDLAPEGIVKINFCPFCGKKIVDNSYEKEIVERELPVIDKYLEYLEPLKSFYCCAFRSQVLTNKSIIDRATIFIPHLSDKGTIYKYSSISRSLKASDYEGYLPYNLTDEWGKKMCIEYNKDSFFNLDKKEFENVWFVKQRTTPILIIDSLSDVEDLFDSIGEYNKKWKWNKERTLKSINKFHNDVLNKIKELENKKKKLKNYEC